MNVHVRSLAALTFALAVATVAPLLAANATAADLPCEKSASDCYCFANGYDNRLQWWDGAWASPEVSSGGTECVEVKDRNADVKVYDKQTGSFLSWVTASNGGGCVVVRGAAQIETKTGFTKKQCAQLIKKQP